MTSVLEDTILATILDDELLCRHEDGGAEWRWTMRCCGEHADLCTRHDQTAQDFLADLRRRHAHAACGVCGHRFGFAPRLVDVYERRPI